MRPLISVIIPTLNEAENIQQLLIHLHSMDENLELIVSDCGSLDGTCEIAKPYAKIVQSDRGRGVQMNAGARAASGDILWFIHADCVPHPDSAKTIHETLKNSKIAGGAFEYNLNSPAFFFRLAEFFSNRKNQIFKLLYGDMGIFIRHEVFTRMNGFREIPLMEDVDFCKRMKREGKIVILPLRINTSTRRWHEEGWMKNWFRNYLLQIGFLLGVPPDRLARWYPFH
ncbi:glycosyltransferase family 2 protein [candidate division KSB1 bacterium]|nr:glycosyltransferase family 2 protein [candidate division KSB1 bacterium]